MSESSKSDMSLKPLCENCACQGEVEFECSGCGKRVKKKSSELNMFESDEKGITINNSGPGKIVINAESIALAGSGLENYLRENIPQMMDLFRAKTISKHAKLKIRCPKRSKCGRKFAKCMHSRKPKNKNRAKPKSEDVDSGEEESRSSKNAGCEFSPAGPSGDGNKYFERIEKLYVELRKFFTDPRNDIRNPRIILSTRSPVKRECEVVDRDEKKRTCLENTECLSSPASPTGDCNEDVEQKNELSVAPHQLNLSDQQDNVYNPFSALVTPEAVG